VQDARDEREFYEKFREHRYRTEWHIPLLVLSLKQREKRYSRLDWKRRGRSNVRLKRWHLHRCRSDGSSPGGHAKAFEVLGLSGTFQKENAEELTFTGDSFDIVYSHGVLHHTLIRKRPSTKFIGC